MEPDIIRLYSSSPPPLDEDGDEEDEDEFGDFGGYCGGVSSSFSFSDFDTPTAFSQALAAETSPPDLHIISVEKVSSSGKNISEEKHRACFAVDSKALVDKTIEKPGVSQGGINGDLHEASSVVISAFQHEISSVSVHGFEDSGTGGEGLSLSNGHRTLNTGTLQEISTVTCFNSKETGPQSGAESSTGPDPYSAASISPREVLDSEGTVEDEVVIESFPISEASESQSIVERKENQEIDKAFSGRQEPSGEETFAVFCDVQSQSGSEGFEDCTETSVGPAAEADEVSDGQSHEDSVNLTTGQLPVGVPGMELGANFKKNNRPPVDLTTEEVYEAEAEKVLGDVKGTIEMNEDFGDFKDPVQGVADISQTESATQDGFADFVTALSGCSTEDDFGDTDTLKDLKEEEELPEEEQEEANDCNTKESVCSELPPSDSFADFSSAPFGGLASGAGGDWVAFGLQEHDDQQESWAAFEKGQPIYTAAAPPCDSVQNDDVLVGLSCKLQHLFQSTFPSEVFPEVPEVLTLQTLLEPQNQENNCPPVQGEAPAMWRHLVDTHSAHGLKVQWVGSRSNRILLDCLGIRNILFTGQKKRPLIVPMFAAGLGMLEPTKDSVKTSTAFSAPVTPSQGRSTLCTQVASSLSCSEDGTSQRRASFSVIRDRALRHSRQKSYS